MMAKFVKVKKGATILSTLPISVKLFYFKIVAKFNYLFIYLFLLLYMTIQKKTSIFDMTEFSFGRKFGLFSRLFLAQLSDKLKHIGVKKHFSILVLIDVMGNQCSQKFIADTLHIDKTLMVGILDELVAVGFIKRVQNPNDRREYWIQLTEKGKSTIPEIKKTIAGLNDGALAGLSSLEIKRFHQYLSVVYNNIQSTS